MANIKIRYKNENYNYEEGITLLDVSKDFSKEYKHDIIIGMVDNKLTSLDYKLVKDCTVDFFDINSVKGRQTYIRGLFFLFVKAVKEVLKCDVRIMYFLEKGIYCEILSNNLISEVTVEKIKIKMRELKDNKIDIKKITVSRLEAIDYFLKTNQKDKAKSLRYITNATINLYKMDKSLDYFYGVLPCNTKYINSFNLKYLGENKIMLLPPVTYALDEKIKYEKMDKYLDEIKFQSKYLENINISTSSDLNNHVSKGDYGDIIRMSETIQNNQLINIVNDISKSKDIKLILLNGPTSSGDLTVSNKLMSYLKWKGYDPIYIKIDDFYLDLKDRIVDDEGSIDNKLDFIDTNQFNKKISELISGKEVILPKYNLKEAKQEFDETKKIRLSSNGIIIASGLHAFSEQLTEMISSKNKCKICIYPLTPLNIDNHTLFKQTDNRLLRKVIKDNKLYGKTASEVFKNWKKIREDEEEYIYPYVKQADYVYNTSLVYELGVLKTYAEPLLFSITEEDENYDDAQRLINIFRMILSIPSEEVPKDSVLREFIGQSCFKDL